MKAVSDEAAFNPLEELDRSEARITVRLETRRFGKPATIIQGIPIERLAEVGRELKRRLGTGGTTKEGRILLQGDHRNHLKDELVRLGFAADHIEIG